MKKSFVFLFFICFVLVLVSCNFDFSGGNSDCNHVWNISITGGSVNLIDGTRTACNVVRSCSVCGALEGSNVLPTLGLGYVESGTDITVSYGTCTACDIVIPSIVITGTGSKTVTTVGSFSDSLIESILLPDSIETIKKGAFTDCHRLSEVYIPDGVSVGNNCFSYCYNLSTVRLPSDMVSLPSSCFVDCHALKNVFPASFVTEANKSSFNGCFLLFDEFDD